MPFCCSPGGPLIDSCLYLCPQVEDLEAIDLLEEYVDASAAVLIFLSGGYFLSRNCKREAVAAVERRKPLVLVHETNLQKGGAPLSNLEAECPHELRAPIFEGRQVIPWRRLGHFQLESIINIAEALLLCSPGYAKTKAADGVPVYVPKAITEYGWTLPAPVSLYVSQHNPGAMAIAELLRGVPLPMVPFTVTDLIPPSVAAAVKAARESERAARATARTFRSVELDTSCWAATRVGGRGALKGGTGSQFDASRGGSTQMAAVHLRAAASTGKKAQRTRLRRSMQDRRGGQHSSVASRASAAFTSPLEALGLTTRRSSESEWSTRHTQVHGGEALERRPWLPSRFWRPSVRSSSSARVSAAPMAELAAVDGSRAATHMLLVLNLSTFVGEEGERLAEEVRAALSCDLPLLMIHVTDCFESMGGCPFDRFFHVTPPDLVRGGLYKPLAVPWYPAPHLRVSTALAVQALGATKTKRASPPSSNPSGGQPSKALGSPAKAHTGKAILEAALEATSRLQGHDPRVMTEPPAGGLSSVYRRTVGTPARETLAVESSQSCTAATEPAPAPAAAPAAHPSRAPNCRIDPDVGRKLPPVPNKLVPIGPGQSDWPAPIAKQ